MSHLHVALHTLDVSKKDAKQLARCEEKRKEWAKHWRCNKMVQDWNEPWENEVLKTLVGDMSR